MWNNPWLRDAENFKVETPIIHDLAHLKVHDLWIHSCKEWDVELLGEIFSPRDAQAIASIPLSSKSPPDSLIWHWDNHGNYTVKSGYRIARWLSLHGNLPSRPVAWNMLWDLSIPPKIKLCLWRACKGCLPTRSALYARGMPVTDTCILCGGHEEDLMHLFLSCLFALSCWSQVDLIPSVNGVSFFLDWFFMFLTNVDKEVVGCVGSII